MSEQIKISYIELENRINELKKMRAEWENYASVKKPDVSGGGMSVTVLNEIGDSYAELYKAVCNLCDNTIEFLENINTSVEGVDRNSAASIKD